MLNLKRPNFTWSLVVAANSKDILENNLLKSGEVDSARDIFVHWDARNAGTAFNAELERCCGDVVVFAHQDIFLPNGWSRRMMEGIKKLFELDNDWGVAGCYGITVTGKCAGSIYSSGLRRFVGEDLKSTVEVRSLDEVLLILNRNSKLKFDEMLPGFHLYGTDICLEAEEIGRKNYVIPCFLVHNSQGINWLPLSFWKAYYFLRQKWMHRLPVVTPCTKISYFCMPIVESIIKSLWTTIKRKDQSGKRLLNAEKFYYENIKGKVKE